MVSANTVVAVSDVADGLFDPSCKQPLAVSDREVAPRDALAIPECVVLVMEP
jgi:hypothetical protein